MRKIPFILFFVLILSGCASNQEAFTVEEVSGSDSAQSSSQPDSGEKKPDLEVRELDSSAASLPVLMYHYIRKVDKKSDLLGYNLSTDPDLFRQEMEWLKDNRYVPITPSQALAGEIPAKAIILTFDDGYRDFYENAFPILKEEGFTAACGIIVSKIDLSGFLTETQLKELSDYGIELMSHSMTHPDLKELEERNAASEIAKSKQQLESMIGKSVPFFVYPSGRYSDKTTSLLKKAGYSGAFTTEPGFADFQDGPFALKRIRIDNRDSLESFQEKIQSK